VIVHVLTAPNISTRAPRQYVGIRETQAHRLKVYGINGRVQHRGPSPFNVSALYLLQQLNAPHLRRNQRMCGLR